jgi:hypothetical protein
VHISFGSGTNTFATSLYVVNFASNTNTATFNTNLSFNSGGAMSVFTATGAQAASLDVFDCSFRDDSNNRTANNVAVLLGKAIAIFGNWQAAMISASTFSFADTTPVQGIVNAYPTATLCSSSFSQFSQGWFTASVSCSVFCTSPRQSVQLGRCVSPLAQAANSESLGVCTATGIGISLAMLFVVLILFLVARWYFRRTRQSYELVHHSLRQHLLENDRARIILREEGIRLQRVTVFLLNLRAL